MRAEGLHGVRRSAPAAPRTTVPGAGPDPRADLVDRQFTAAAPNCLWVADITNIRTFSGWVYASFGGGVGGGAVGTAAAVLDVGGAGAAPVAGLRMGALARHPGLETLGSATGLLEAVPVLRTRVPPMVRVGQSGGGVVGGVAAARAGAPDPHRRTGRR